MLKTSTKWPGGWRLVKRRKTLVGRAPAVERVSSAKRKRRIVRRGCVVFLGLSRVESTRNTAVSQSFVVFLLHCPFANPSSEPSQCGFQSVIYVRLVGCARSADLQCSWIFRICKTSDVSGAIRSFPWYTIASEH